MTAERPLRVALLAAPLLVAVVVSLLTPRPAFSGMTGDLAVYFDDSGRLLGGAIPYAGFPLEYPPLSLVPMTLPRLLWPFASPDPDTYQWLFALIEGCLGVVVGWVVARLAGGRRQTLAVWTALAVVAGVSITWRYDIWPAMAVLLAVAAAHRGRPALAGVAIGVGTMLKLFPIVVLAILVARALALRDRRGVARLALGAAATIAVVMGAAFAIAGPDSLGWLTYELNRGLQLESAGSGLLLLFHVVADHPFRIVHDFGTLQVDSPGADVVATASTAVELALVAGVGLVALLRFRREAADQGAVSFASLASAVVAILVALIVSSKVFSVQYIVWFLPLAPFLPGRVRWLALTVTAVSTLIYPLDYTALWHLDPLLAVVLNVRNGMLIAMLGWLVLLLVRPVPGAAHRRGVLKPSTQLR